MSKKEQFIRLQPPAVGFGAKKRMHRKEMLVLKNFACPVCHGDGWISNPDPNELIDLDCPMCLGIGTLDAKVVIEWVPEKNKNYE